MRSSRHYFCRRGIAGYVLHWARTCPESLIHSAVHSLAAIWRFAVYCCDPSGNYDHTYLRTRDIERAIAPVAGFQLFRAEAPGRSRACSSMQPRHTLGMCALQFLLPSASAVFPISSRGRARLSCLMPSLGQVRVAVAVPHRLSPALCIFVSSFPVSPFRSSHSLLYRHETPRVLTRSWNAAEYRERGYPKSTHSPAPWSA